ncbi:hypothetical protein [Nocardia asiatica]|uniref:hypothetical protein n=1 Tax=Nocardia asiatica TaxID=209252 RepID=UPI002456973C|nr:hypothetical protein [Nocardia asiatica]
MSPLLVSVPWVGSVVFVGVLCFRAGVWWQGVRLLSAHTDALDSRRSDEAGEDCSWPTVVVDLAVDDADTEVLPQIQDIVPPLRPTPIRRPPWLCSPGVLDHKEGPRP